MITIRLNLWALLRPSCWMLGHIWEGYVVIHSAWNRDGRWCRVCRKQQFVSWSHEFQGDKTIHVRTDWNGTERFVWEQSGNGSNTDPIRMVKVGYLPEDNG